MKKWPASSVWHLTAIGGQIKGDLSMSIAIPEQRVNMEDGSQETAAWAAHTGQDGERLVGSQHAATQNGHSLKLQNIDFVNFLCNIFRVGGTADIRSSSKGELLNSASGFGKHACTQSCL